MRVTVISELPLPTVNERVNVWQPVTDRKSGLAMRLAPLEWQPSGAHHCIQHLLNENLELKKRLREVTLAK